MSNAEKIYYNFERLNENCVDLPETKEAHKNLWDYLKQENYLGGGVRSVSWKSMTW